MDEEKLIEGLTISEMLEKYKPIIWRIINKKWPNTSVDKEDLFQEAQIAVWESFNKYEPQPNGDFGGLAYVNMMGAMLNFLRKNITQFSGSQGIIYKYRCLYKQLGRTPTYEELREAGFRDSSIIGLHNFFGTYAFSLDQLVGDSDENYHNVISIDDCFDLVDPSSIDFNSFNWEQYLSQQEQDVVVYYFGFNKNTGSLTKNDISKKLDIPLYMVENILQSALNKLRGSSEIKSSNRTVNAISTKNVLPNDVDDLLKSNKSKSGRTFTKWDSSEERDTCQKMTIDLMKDKGVTVLELADKLNIPSDRLYSWCAQKNIGNVKRALSHDLGFMVLEYLKSRPTDYIYVKDKCCDVVKGRRGRRPGTKLINGKLSCVSYVKPGSPIEIPSDISKILYIDSGNRFKSNNHMLIVQTFFQSVHNSIGNISFATLYDILKPHLKTIKSSALLYQGIMFHISADRSREIVDSMIAVGILANDSTYKDKFVRPNERPRNRRKEVESNRKRVQRRRPTNLIHKFKIPKYVYLSPLTSGKLEWKDDVEMFGYMGFINDMMEYHKIKTVDVSRLISESRETIFNWRYKSCTTDQAYQMYKTILQIIELNATS